MTETIKLAASRTFRSLRTPNYRRYFWAQIISMTGTWLQAVAQIWLVLSLTGSAVARDHQRAAVRADALVRCVGRGHRRSLR